MAPLFLERLKMKSKVLIISCEADSHVAAVKPYLESLQVDAHLLVPEKLLDTAITVNPADAQGKLVLGSDTVDLSDIGAVWFRKPGPIDVNRFAEHLSCEELDFVQAEGQEIVDGIYALLNSRFWLTNPPASRLSGRKLVQLSVAREVGFTVPRTIVTNDVRQARDFAATAKAGLAIKSLSWASVMQPAGDSVLQYGVYCRRLTSAETADGLELVSNAPTLLQEYVPKRCDLRVVAVGRKHLFSVEIDSQNGGFSSEDCRFQIQELPHRLVERPNLVEPIRRYMELMNLNFACFDFAVSSETNELVFLEANINGQWLWLERKTGAPIARAIAETLAESAQ
jgi:glutathione synthase/RimK-type ligase-like ATP-grasp enzyme